MFRELAKSFSFTKNLIDWFDPVFASHQPPGISSLHLSLFPSPRWGWSSELLPKSLLEDTFNFDALLWKSGNSVVFVELWGEISAVHKNHFIFSKLQPSQKNHLCNVRDMNPRLALYDWMIVNFFYDQYYNWWWNGVNFLMCCKFDGWVNWSRTATKRFP